jgi:quercetin dioxygenase-like cupin family protein
MKLSTLLIVSVVILALAGIGLADEHRAGKKPDILAGTIEGLTVDNVLTSQLELAEGVEVVVSHVVIPPHTELPKHWHPGEEFVYVLEGSGILWQDGLEDMSLKAGDVVKVPLKQVHTARTAESAATILVFRVHESGQPVRVLVE